MELTEEILYFWFSLTLLSPQKRNIVLDNYSIFELYDRIGNDQKLEEFFSQNIYQNLLKAKDNSYLSQELEKVYKAGIGFITINDKRYPEKLKQKEILPPCLLYYKGDVNLLDTTSVAMVGTRHCSSYGKDVALGFAAQLAEYGITVVSGMATGIDSYSHEGILKNNGKTIAVLGSGVNCPTPRSNYALYNEICKNGVVVSEYPINMDATKFTFPERNRIISGLSNACIVVEASYKSGSLITADRASEQNREVFAVPGNITSPKSEGVNMLIKNGAHVLTSIKDILSCFNLQKTKITQNTTALLLDIFEEKIYNLIQKSENGALSFDNIVEMSDFTLSEVFKIVFSLEMKNVIVRRPNNIIELARKIV